MPAAGNVIAMKITHQLFKEKLYSLPTANISNKHISSQPLFLLLSKQEPLVSRKVPVFVYLSLLLLWTAFSKTWNGSSVKNGLRSNLWFFKRYLYNSNFYPISFRDLNVNLGTLNVFSTTSPKSLQSTFCFILTIFKIQLLVVWLT